MHLELNKCYEAPKTEVLVLKMETSILGASDLLTPTDYPNGGDPFSIPMLP